MRRSRSESRKTVGAGIQAGGEFGVLLGMMILHRLAASLHKSPRIKELRLEVCIPSGISNFR
jgi:hypothetical protein